MERKKEGTHNLKHYSQSLARMQPRYLSITCQIFHLKVLKNTGMYNYKYKENYNLCMSAVL